MIKTYPCAIIIAFMNKFELNLTYIFFNFVNVNKRIAFSAFVIKD